MGLNFGEMTLPNLSLYVLFCQSFTLQGRENLPQSFAVYGIMKIMQLNLTHIEKVDRENILLKSI